MRKLTPLTPNGKSQIFYVADTETGKQRGKNIHYKLSARPEHFVIGAVVGSDGYRKVFHSREEMIHEFKTTRYRGRTVYFHNAEYDLCVLYGNIYFLDKEAIFNGKFISATNRNCTFVDSYNILQASAESIGEMLGKEKLTLGRKTKNGTIIGTLQIGIDRCVRDCEIICDALHEMFIGAKPTYTIGQLSLQMFRRYFLPEPIVVSDLSDRFFDAYYGGRNEVFKVGKCDAKVYDINSAYPYAMSELDFPDPFALHERYVYPDEVPYLIERYEGMITARIRYKKDLHIPPLPLRHDGKLLFPLGAFSGSWCFNEFRIAMPFIEIITPCKLIISRPIASPFKEFITHYFTERQKTDNDFSRYYYKLFMNNLYGKLAQKIKNAFVMLRNESDIRRLMKKHNSISAEIIRTYYGSFLNMKIPERMTKHTIACWAAYITAQVRVNLWKALHANSAKAVYCDTDSIFIEGEPKRGSIEFGENLGQWGIEKKRITRVRTLKDYAFTNLKGDELKKLKGVKKDAVEVEPTTKEMEYMAQFADPAVYEFSRMIKTKESIRRLDSVEPGTFVKQRKVITGQFTKRKIFKDGTTTPFKLNLP